MCMGEVSQILIRFGRGLSGRVSSEVSSDVCMGEGSQIIWIRFWGGCRAGCRLVSSDVCMGEGSQILIRFGGAVGQGVV